MSDRRPVPHFREDSTEESSPEGHAVSAVRDYAKAGAYLRRARQTSGLSLDELAARLVAAIGETVPKVTPSYLRVLEQGRSAPDPRHIEHLERELYIHEGALHHVYGYLTRAEWEAQWASRRPDEIEADVKSYLLSQPLLDAREAQTLVQPDIAGEAAATYIARLQRQGSLLALPTDEHYVYPRFQIDEEGHLDAAVGQVNCILDARSDPWGAASWWATPMERLGGRKPLDLVGTPEASQLVSLAKVERSPLG